ncbi:MAG: trigger factor [Deltaproteobacteria bacterium]|nr:trigger factor [Deltaproteobacteria bacterium]
MKVQVEEITPVKKKLLVEVSQEEYLKKVEDAYQKLQKKVSIKGFRKGKVPRPMLEKYYKDQTESEVFSNLIQDSYVWALNDQKLTPVAPPQINELKKEENQPISYQAEVEIRPVVTLKKYKELDLKKPSVEVLEEEMNKELEGLRNAQAQLSPLAEDIKAKNGQIAVIDFEGKVDGSPFEGGSAKGVMLELGLGRFLKDFEDGVVGMKKSEKKEVNVEFPADYPSKDLAGKKAIFEITLQDLKEKILPELNDDFAKDLGNFESLDQIKEKIKENIGHQKEHSAKGALFNQAVDALIQEHPFEIPDAMIEQELGAMLENTRRQLSQQGMTLEKAGVNPDEFKVQNKDLAIRRIRGLLIFEAIALAEKIEVTPQEMSSRVVGIAQSVGQKPEVVDQYYRENKMYPMLVSQILEEKVLDYLISQAKVSNA